MKEGSNSRDLPLGFAMSLAQNTDAMIRFGEMSEEQRESALNMAKSARSGREMKNIVNQIANNSLS